MAHRFPPLHMIDFEGSLASGILEYGVAVLEDAKITALHTRLCANTGKISTADTEVHGLTSEVLAGQTPFATDFESFAGWRKTGPFAAHHAPAENSLIRATWPLVRQVPLFASEHDLTNDWGPWLDSAALYRHVFGASGKGSLSTLVQRFGLQTQLDTQAARWCPEGRRRYHAAPYDALASALLLADLLQRQELQSVTLAWLFQASTENPGKRERLSQGDLGL